MASLLGNENHVWILFAKSRELLVVTEKYDGLFGKENDDWLLVTKGEVMSASLPKIMMIS